MCELYDMMHCIILIQYSSIVKLTFQKLLDHFDSNLRIIIIITSDLQPSTAIANQLPGQ